jgi:hypothetical protein
MLKTVSRSLLLAALTLLLAALPMAAADLPAPLGGQSLASAGCNATPSDSVDLVSLLAGSSMSPVEAEKHSPIFLSCSGDACGCYEPTCTSQCGPPPNPCHSACRKEQVQCAIWCCAD